MRFWLEKFRLLRSDPTEQPSNPALPSVEKKKKKVWGWTDDQLINEIVAKDYRGCPAITGDTTHFKMEFIPMQ